MRTLTDALDDRAARRGSEVVYRFLRDGESESAVLSFGELHARATGIAAELTSRGARGDRAVLLYPQGLDFIAAFFACLYAGVTAVPANAPRGRRGIDDLRRVARDAQAKWLVSLGALVDPISDDIRRDADLGPLVRIDTDHRSAGERRFVRPAVGPDEVALLQYTSGSTGSPRGVALTHTNLCHNQGQIEQCFGCEEPKLVSWLPLFHDMGLGTALQAVWAGGSCVLMAPQSFLQGPGRWLKAISTYRATVSGAPDFAAESLGYRVVF